MAIDTRLVDGKNGVLEKNAVTYPRTGNIMAMYPLDEGVKGENGMLLEVDYANKLIKYPTSSSEVVMILDTAEKEYDKNVVGLDQHYITSEYGYMPRLGKLVVNDRFTTSTVSYDSAVFADIDAIEAAIEDGVYGAPCTTTGFEGTIALSKAVAGGPVALKAVAVTTIPNGDAAIKFAVIRAN